MSSSSSSSSSPLSYYAESTCTAITKTTGRACRNNAHYEGTRCSMHKLTPDAKCLPVSPDKSHHASLESARDTTQPGVVSTLRVRMWQSAPFIPGMLNVFPNFKAGDFLGPKGLGCSQLSPMKLGPVEHGEMDADGVTPLPPARNLENYYQSAKVFDREYDSSTDTILPCFWETLKQRYADDQPRRHKFQRGITPFFAARRDALGVEHRYTYVQSRVFYCKHYEKLAKQQPQFAALQKKKQDGYHFRICGYDSPKIPISSNTDDLVAKLAQLYQSEEQPFGHELVLFTMLCVDDSRQYPWNA